MKIQAIKSYTYANIGTNNRNNPPEINSKPDNISKSPSEMPRIGRSSIIYFTSNINFGEQNKNPQKKFDLNGKTILITGGTGTIGNYLINSLFENYSPKKVIVYSRDELKQHVMKQKSRENQKLEYIIGDVRDEKALQRAFRNVDAVIHTAAMKHVPFCEENPEEAVKTNIDGARNIINAAIDNDVKRVLFVSSDKASSPSNLYGATKFVSEKLFNHANKYTEEGGPRFSCVRLGNVLGSRGSIIPLFKEQSKSGTIKVTDKDMTRFFMTPQQASELILTGIEMMNGAEIFIPKLKNTSILELAKQVAPDAKVEFIGARPGEKLDEDFISPVEEKNTLELEDRYVILPQEDFKNREKLWNNAKALPENYNYSSKNTKFKMNSDDLKTLINQYV